MKCCGQDRTTKFCPECGTRIAFTPLHVLLRQVQSSGKHHLTTARKYEAKSEEYPNHGDHYRRLASRARMRCENNQTWADELEKAIAALAEKETK